VLLVGVLHNSHEGVCEDGNEDCDDEEVTDEEKQGEDGSTEKVVGRPHVPGCRCEAHDELESVNVSQIVTMRPAKSDLQCIRDLGAVGLVIAERQRKGDKETTAADDNEDKDSHHVLGHHSKSDEQLRKVLVMVQYAEQARE